MKYIKFYFSATNERSRNLVKQIRWSFFFKIGSMGLSFLLVPTIIQTLGERQYGLWSLMIMFTTWTMLFDIGIGNSVRNLVTKAMASNKVRSARIYISSGYTLLGLISLTMLVVAILLLNFLFYSMSNGLKENLSLNVSEFYSLNVFIFTAFVVFWLGLIHAVVASLHKAALSLAIYFTINVLLLFAFQVISQVVKIDLLLASMIFSIVNIGTLLGFSLIFFFFKPRLSPYFMFRKKHYKSIVSVGVSFFLIQVASLILFATDKALISYFFKPELLVEYDLVFKLFSVAMIVQGIFSSSVWSAYTESFALKDKDWIQNEFIRQFVVFLLVSILAGLTYYFSADIINYWADISVEEGFEKYLFLFVLVSMWNSLYAIPLNAFSKVKVQVLTSVAIVLLNMPLSYYFAIVLNYGPNGIILGSVVCLLLPGIILPVVFFKELSKINRSPGNFIGASS